MEISSCTNFNKCFSLLQFMIVIYSCSRSWNTKNYYSDNSHACCFWIKILTGSQWCFLTHVFSMPKLKDKFTFSKGSQIISLRLKKINFGWIYHILWVIRWSITIVLIKVWLIRSFEIFFSSREGIHKRYNESHICIFQYSSSHIKNKRKLVVVI